MKEPVNSIPEAQQRKKTSYLGWSFLVYFVFYSLASSFFSTSASVTW
jgi:hypothetical protein